jgi:hypothetical protein
MKTKSKTKFTSVDSIAKTSDLSMFPEASARKPITTQSFLNLKSLALALLFLVQPAWADSIFPISTATLFETSVDYKNFLLVGGLDQGDLQFDRFDRTQYVSYQLELFNPGSANSVPLNVYGYYLTAHSQATALDYNTGNYLGTIQPPLDSSSPWTLDVTSFINTLNFDSYSWFGFDFRPVGNVGGDEFTSLAMGSPLPQLNATPVPEPSLVAVLGLTLLSGLLMRFVRFGRLRQHSIYNDEIELLVLEKAAIGG